VGVIADLLDPPDLVDVVPDELWVVEEHVPVDGPGPEDLVVVVELVVAGLDHGEVPPLLVLHLSVVVLLDGELGHVVVNGLDARGRSLQQPDGVVGSVHVV